MNKNVVLIISKNEYKDVSVNHKCIKPSMNRSQNKGHRIGIYKITKMSLSSFDEKVYNQNNGYHGLALGC